MKRRGVDGFFEKFNRHTRLKLFLLETYLAAWASILLPYHPRGWFVDGFAGKGRDEQGNPGSPLIACNLSKKIRADFLSRGLKRELRVVAIEANRARFKALRQTLAEFTTEGGCAEVILGEAWEGIKKVLGESGNEPLIAFIDPFGVKGLSATNVAKLLSVRRREALILFNDVAANRLLASSKAKPKRRPDPTMDMFAEMGPLYPTKTDEAEATEEKFSVWQVKHLKILIEAFGDMWPSVETELQQTPEKLRRRLLADRYVDCLSRESGALYVIPMSITDEKGKHHYYLVHASTSPSAAVAMKRAIHKAFGARDRESNAMFQGMSFQSAANLDKAAERDCHAFRWKDGQMGRWE